MSQQPPEQLYTSAITVAEMQRGVASLPNGTEKQKLHQAVTAMLNEDFHQRVFSFDQAAAENHAPRVQQRQEAGRPVSQSDAQIASIALSVNATLVTRNTKDFSGLATQLINPWNTNG